MSNLVGSDYQPFVAYLVLGYLEKQQLDGAYAAFLDTSRHLAEDKKDLKLGNKPIDTSIGLVKLVSEYYKFKNRIAEFLRLCPRSPLKNRLIDTDDALEQLDIILDTFKYNLKKVEKVSSAEKQPPLRKRRQNEREDEFEVSQSNASTPEPEHAAKKRRKSVTLPFLIQSSSKENSSKSLNRSKLLKSSLDQSLSSSESDVDVIVNTEIPTATVSQLRITPPPIAEKIIESLPENTEISSKLAQMINQTINNKQLDSVDDIVDKTTHEPGFDEVLRELLNEYEYFLPQTSSENQNDRESQQNETPPSSTEKENREVEQPRASTSKASLSSTSWPSTSTTSVTRRQLRPRKAATPASRKKKKVGKGRMMKKKKIEIISDEPYHGEIPECALSHPATTQKQPSTSSQQPFINVPVVMINDGGFILSQDIGSMPIVSLVPGTNEYTLISSGTIAGDLEASQQPPPIIEEVVVDSISEHDKMSAKKQCTPKLSQLPAFAEARSKSTPRRRGSHIRTLDFNKASSITKLIRERTPSTPVVNGLPKKTPGSAPPVCTSSKLLIKETPKLTTVQESLIDDNSNSNSTTMSTTPRVGKNHRRRRIVDAPQCDENEAAEAEVEIIGKSKDALDAWHASRNKNAEEIAREQNQLKEEKRRQAKKKPPRARKPPAPKEKPAPKPKKTPAKRKRKSVDPPPESSPETPEKTTIVPAKPEQSGKAQVKIRITPKKKPCSKLKKIPPAEEKESETNKSNSTIAEEEEDQVVQGESEMNRSDTVQEVATTLTQLSETILLKGGESTKKDPDMMKLLEATPFKEFTLEPDDTPFKGLLTHTEISIPNTPRFAIPINNVNNDETPMPKSFCTTATLSSLIKINPDIVTPAGIPPTPGFGETPLKDLLDGQSPSAGSGYSRKTDYSSCSSYYKPDESEDIAQIFSQKGKNSERFSESDAEKPLKIVAPSQLSAKKVECSSVTIERVRSFTENDGAIAELHYNMVEDGVMSESVVTTTEDSSGSYGSSFTCSTCTTSDDEENSVQKLLNLTTDSDKNEKDWNCHQASNDQSGPLIDENTGEVRYPLRNWITPRKVETENVPAVNIVVPEVVQPDPAELERIRREKQQTEEEERRRILSEKLERMKAKIKKDEARFSKTSEPSSTHSKLTKHNLKNYKIPANMPKAAITNKKQEILNSHHKERELPTTLKVQLPLPSSSRRKSATPRKTTKFIDEIPRRDLSPVKERKKKEKKSDVKSPSKTDRLSLEMNDNAVMPEVIPPPLANSSSSFATSFGSESSKKSHESPDTSAETTKVAAIIEKPKCDQKDILGVMSESDDSSDESSSEEEEELVIRPASEEKIVSCMEPENFEPSMKPLNGSSRILPIIVKEDGVVKHCKDSGVVEIFTVEPKKIQDIKKSKKSSKNNENGHVKNGKSAKSESDDNSKGRIDAPASKSLSKLNIDRILNDLHGKK